MAGYPGGGERRGLGNKERSGVLVEVGCRGEEMSVSECSADGLPDSDDEDEHDG